MNNNHYCVRFGHFLHLCSCQNCKYYGYCAMIFEYMGYTKIKTKNGMIWHKRKISIS